MTTMTRSLVAAVAAAMLVFAPQAPAAEPASTTVTIPEMECASCAKKVGGKVTEVPGVAKVEYSVEARILKVTHKPGETPSPKALWEAVEKGGKDPSKLEGPAGTFTKKPTV